MLPLPSTFAFPSKQSSNHRFSWFRNYVRRSRATNLAVSLLATSLLLSLALNFRQWLRGVHSNYTVTNTPKAYLGAPLQPTTASHLIIVAGHAVWKGCDPSEWALENNWVLHDYQKGRNDSLGIHPSTFYTHIIKGAELLGADLLFPPGMLVFSGGVTRPTHPFQSEAQSYLNLALSNNLIPSRLRFHTYTEDFALDSFQNLLFSIMRFHEVALASGMGGGGVGTASIGKGSTMGMVIPNRDANGKPRRNTWPEKITVVGFEMKRARFVELHRAALRWPKERFEYIGVDLADEENREQAAEGERVNGYLPYTQDLYGCTGTLAAKRVSRNPFARFHSYYTTNPELAALMDWCPAALGRGDGTVESQVFPGPLPWD